jgi:ABC-type phosphate transport system substrate-binding protein
MIRYPAIIVVILMTAALVEPTAQSRVQAAPSKQGLAIIVNRENSIDNLSMTDLRSMFLGERSHWPNGRRITLVMMEPGQPERETLLRDVCRMSESDLRRRFLQGLLTGEVLVSPKTLSSPAGVRKFVFNVPGAIGYLRPEDVDDSVKVIRIDGHLPGDAEYPLKIAERSQS